MLAKYLNITEANFRSRKCVQKFMPLERALQLLETKKMWFSNPAKWPDPYERRFVDGVYPFNKKFAWKDRVYCMCVTPIATSEASWKAYSDKDIAVKLEFDRNEYADIINNAVTLPGVTDVYFGQMDYQQTKDIEKPLSQIVFSDGATPGIRTKLFTARLLLLKRIAFRYECEYRAIIVKKAKSHADGILIDIPDLSRLIKSITIGPSAGDKEYEMIKNHLINTYHFRADQIQQSQLYKSSKKPQIKI